MVDINGFIFGLFLIGIILVVIFLLIVLSAKKVIKSKKENQSTNPLYIFVIVFGLLFLLSKMINQVVIPIFSIIVGIIGNIYNYKNKQNKYFVLGIIVYSLMLIYGLAYIG